MYHYRLHNVAFKKVNKSYSCYDKFAEIEYDLYYPNAECVSSTLYLVANDGCQSLSQERGDCAIIKRFSLTSQKVLILLENHAEMVDSNYADGVVANYLIQKWYFIRLMFFYLDCYSEKKTYLISMIYFGN